MDEMELYVGSLEEEMNCAQLYEDCAEQFYEEYGYYEGEEDDE